MRIDTTALLSILAATCAADSLTFWEEYRGWTTFTWSKFTTDYGTYDVDGSSGCRGTGVPGMMEFCVDWPRRRGHFKFNGQGKRCLVQRYPDSGWYKCSGDNECQEWTMVEAPCTW